jgi:hypothetical protein
VIVILAIVATSVTHLAADLSSAADVLFHLAMLIVLLAGLVLIVRATKDSRERIWSLAVLVLWGITTTRYVTWLGVLAILAGGAGMALVWAGDARTSRAPSSDA